MAWRWMFMTRSYRRLLCFRNRGTAKRFACLLAAALLLLSAWPLASAGADPQRAWHGPSADTLPRLTRQRLDAAEQANARALLDALPLGDGDSPIRIGSWVLHPAGFAFRIPEGYQFSGAYKGADIMLVAASHGAGSVRSSIAVTLSAEQDLTQMTRERVERAYPSSFPGFALRHYEEHTMLGASCLSITFVSSQSPQLLCCQRLLNKDGLGLIITLQAENIPARVAEGVTAYAQFCDSLMFPSAAQAAK